jgi:hypothetical protein
MPSVPPGGQISCSANNTAEGRGEIPPLGQMAWAVFAFLGGGPTTISANQGQMGAIIAIFSCWGGKQWQGEGAVAQGGAFRTFRHVFLIFPHMFCISQISARILMAWNPKLGPNNDEIFLLILQTHH